jgi:arsenical-resistance protein 2
LKEKGDGTMRSCVLVEGIMGWAGAGGEYVEMMDGYVEDTWKT